MKPDYEKSINKLIVDIRKAASDLPRGKRNLIHNKCSKLTLTLKKQQKSYGCKTEVHCKTGNL